MYINLSLKDRKGIANACTGVRSGRGGSAVSTSSMTDPNLTLPMLRLLSSKVQWRKDLRKPSKPCLVGTHWKALAVCYQVSTHLPRFQSFFMFFLHFFALVKWIPSSIKVNTKSQMRLHLFNPLILPVAKISLAILLNLSGEIFFGESMKKCTCTLQTTLLQIFWKISLFPSFCQKRQRPRQQCLEEL